MLLTMAIVLYYILYYAMFYNTTYYRITHYSMSYLLRIRVRDRGDKLCFLNSYMMKFCHPHPNQI